MAKNEEVTAAGCIAAIVSTPLAILIRGWSLKTLWLWFVVPQFDLGPLTITSAYGLALVAGLLIPTTHSDGDVWTMIALSLFMPLIFVAFGWMILQF